jgi:hypothetical protein
MGMYRNTPGKYEQRGAIVVVTAIALVALIGISGLALDMGHAFINKTRLQNTVDAVALAAAKELDVTGSVTAADAIANVVFQANADAAGNGELSTAVAGGLSMVTEYSDTLYPFVPGGVDPQYVRARVEGMTLGSWLIQILGINTKTVSARAVAGPSPTLENICSVAPMMVCGDEAAGPPFFGYTEEAVETLKTSSGADGNWEVGPGNFQLIRLEDATGGADIREAMAGSYDACLASDEDIDTEPGNTVGPVVQGINTRLGIYNGPYSSHSPATSPYKPDLVITQNTVPIVEDVTAAADLDFNFDDYQADVTACSAANSCEPHGLPERRILPLPIGNCNGTASGQGNVPLLGFACFFLLQETIQQGNQAKVYGQFVEDCKVKGYPGPDPNNGPGPYVIQLYEDESTPDS